MLLKTEDGMYVDSGSNAVLFPRQTNQGWEIAYRGLNGPVRVLQSGFESVEDASAALDEAVASSTNQDVLIVQPPTTEEETD